MAKCCLSASSSYQVRSVVAQNTAQELEDRAVRTSEVHDAETDSGQHCIRIALLVAASRRR